MAVFTQVTIDEASRFIEKFELGKLHALRGISTGIENTNYFLTAEGGEFVLTLFERLTHIELPFYLNLMQHLAANGIPVPDPCSDSFGNLLFELNGRPAALVRRLPGSHRKEPSSHHCEQVGEMLARMHLAGSDFAFEQASLRGLPWWIEASHLALSFLSKEKRDLLLDEIAFQKRIASSVEYCLLPRGPVHGDLFRDNVLFVPENESRCADYENELERLSGFFDFYFAGTDVLIFDVAVCLNEWCIDQRTGFPVNSRATSFLAAYERIRPLTSIERMLLPAVLRAAALRFWLSRLIDFYMPREASLLHPHDPEHFFQILCRLRVNEQPVDSDY
jgi:homoserine kinase type II